MFLFNPRIVAFLAMSATFDSGAVSQLDGKHSRASFKTLTPGDYTQTMMFGGVQRTYVLHIPAAVPNRGIPVVFYIHGGGGTPQAAYLDHVDQTSDKFGFIMVAPAGLKKAWNGGTWITGSCCGNADDVGFISKIIDELLQSYPIDSNRIYAMGISNGGLMTNRLACDLSSRIAAIATVAPAGIEESCSPERSVPVMDIHGTGDRCNPYYGGTPPFSYCADVAYTRMTPRQVVNSWSAIDGCTWHNPQIVYQNGDATCVSTKNCDGSGEMEFCKVIGMGHTWPSGGQYLPASDVGSVSYDISTDQIWNFFNQHPMQ
jgi:polyhydroxybutyrate depolymerase